jgi:hypothetical protein
MDIMRYLSFLLSIILLLVARQSAYATNSVTITNSGTGTSQTHVKIDTNGEVKSFDTTDGEEVDWTSDDGQSTVKINTTTKNPIPTSQTRTEAGRTDTDKEGTITPTPTKEEDKATEERQSFSLSDFFRDMFSFFGFGKK